MARARTPTPRRLRSQRGFSLVEVLLAAVILGLVGVAVLSIFGTSKESISRTDTRRTVRFYMQEIFAHIERRALHDLWDDYGPPPYSESRMQGALARRGPDGKLEPGAAANPLGFTQEFLDDMRRDGYDGQLTFEFFSKKQLKIGPNGEADPGIGILHMQAGYAEATLVKLGADGSSKPVTVWRKPIMCPAVVGRPGLRLSSCPAIAPKVKEKYEPLLEKREAALEQ